MKTFLEEYGFVILIAIVIILLVVMATPIGNTIKASVLGLTDSFGSKTSAKIDKTNKELTVTLNGSELTIESISETDKYVAILRGYQGGKEVSVASVDDKLTCTNNMSNVATFADATGNAETTSGIAKFVIENGYKLDENTEYYIEIMNIGTGEIFKSDISMKDHHIGISNINTALAVGDFSTKGNLVTVNGTSYRVLESNGTQAKLLAMDSYKSSAYNSSSVTIDFNGTPGQQYSGSLVDTEMANFYNSLPVELQNAIVDVSIKQSMYSYSDNLISSEDADFTSWHNHPITEDVNQGTNYYLKKIGEVSVGKRKVYAIDIDDVIAYLGANSTAKDVNEMIFGTRNDIVSVIWTRTTSNIVSTDDDPTPFYIYGYYGIIRNGNYVLGSAAIRPVFIIDLSLVS